MTKQPMIIYIITGWPKSIIMYFRIIILGLYKIASYNGANVYYNNSTQVQSRNPSKVNISIHLNRFCLLKCLKQLLSMSELLDVQDIQESSLLCQGQ